LEGLTGLASLVAPVGFTLTKDPVASNERGKRHKLEHIRGHLNSDERSKYRINNIVSIYTKYVVLSIYIACFNYFFYRFSIGI
jgi:hypothetical protein